MKVRLLLLAAAFLAACTPLPAGTPTSTLSTTTTTVGGGGTSQTAVLQAQLDTGSLYVNSTVVSDGTLRPPAGATITFGPSGRLVRTSASTGSAVEVKTANVTVNSLRVTGPDPCYWTLPPDWGWPAQRGESYSQYDAKREEEHGLALRDGATNVTVNGLDVQAVWGDALYLDGVAGASVSNVVGRCLGRSGISNVNSSNVTVTGGAISGAYYWGLNIEPFSTKSVSSYTVSGVTFGFTRAPWAFAGGPYFNCAVTGVDFRVNTLLASATTPASIASCVSNQVRL